MIAKQLRFDLRAGDFTDYHDAKKWLEDCGFSVGRMQANSPIGILYGCFDIQKWRNLSSTDRLALDGVMTGDMRNGPVLVSLWTSASPEAIDALKYFPSMEMENS